MTRRLLRAGAQLLVVIAILAIYAILVIRGQIVGELPW
jgi:hypothetical protein